MLPDYLIIGSARCGTTYIAKNLEAHPEIFMPQEKELHYFDRKFDRGIEYYKSLFPKDGSGYLVVGEATPAYLYVPEIASRIHEYVPDAKLIISLRNPVDAAYSMYWNAYATDERTRRISFEKKLKDEPRLIQGGKYYEQIERYLDLFPRENIHIIIYEELIKNPGAEFSRLYKFLGVDGSFDSPYMGHEINSSSMKNGRSKLLYYGYIIFLKYLKVPAIARWLEKINSKKDKKMAPETRRKLAEEFRESNKKLEELLYRDLTIWYES